MTNKTDIYNKYNKIPDTLATWCKDPTHWEIGMVMGLLSYHFSPSKIIYKNLYHWFSFCTPVVRVYNILYVYDLIFILLEGTVSVCMAGNKSKNQMQSTKIYIVRKWITGKKNGITILSLLMYINIFQDWHALMFPY